MIEADHGTGHGLQLDEFHCPRCRGCFRRLHYSGIRLVWTEEETLTEEEIDMRATRVVYLNQEHWSLLIKALYETAGRHGRPTGALGQLWRLLAEASQHKRFTIEVENNHD
jgi:hypothetical protein